MKLRYLSVFTIVCLILTMVFAACGTEPQVQEEAQPETQEEAQPAAQEETEPAAQEEAQPAEQEAEPLRIAAVLPGSIKDEGYNQDFYEGLLKVEETFGAEIAYSESTPVADFESVYRDFADQGYDVIIGHGFEFGEVALKVGPDYPDIKFIVDSHPDLAAANVAGINGKSWEAAYLCGVLAGLMTKTNQIGGIAGFDFPILISQMEAYKLGAESVNPDVKVTTVYVGSFEDVSKAKEATLAQASVGVDVVFHVADAAGIGVIQACEEAGIMAIGWGPDQNYLAPQTVITSMLFDSAELLMQDIQLVVDGTWTGATRLYGLDSGVVGLADYHGLVPDDVAAQVEQVKNDIISGKLVVPYISEVGQEAEVEVNETPAEPLRIAAVLPGSIKDEGYNQDFYEGLLKVEETFGAEIAYSESTPVADFEAVYRDFADQGYDVIIGHGFEFGEVALKVGPDYPDVKFIVDSHPDLAAANVAGINGKSWEAAYLCGVLAGLMTKTNQIGGIAGFDFPILISQMEAYKLGAESVNPDIQVTTVYVGSFEDVSKAKEATLAQASVGVDVVFHVADAAGIGVIQACEEAGIMAIGWGPDQNYLAPQTVITSMLFDSAELLMQDIQLVVDGTWTGATRLYGLDSGVVGLADYHGLVPDDVAAQVEQVKNDIISGKLVVPYIAEASQ